MIGFGIGLWGAFGLLATVGITLRLLALVFLKRLVRKLE